MELNLIACLARVSGDGVPELTKNFEQWIERLPPMSSLVNVKWLRTMMTLTLAAFWLVALNHCRLEQIPGLSFLVCCAHDDAAPHQDNDCDTDGCAAVEGSFYKLEDAQASFSAPVLVLPVSLTLSLDELEAASADCSDFYACAPPELLVTWQFSYRTALPPRAPSFAS